MSRLLLLALIGSFILSFSRLLSLSFDVLLDLGLDLGSLLFLNILSFLLIIFLFIFVVLLGLIVGLKEVDFERSRFTQLEIRCFSWLTSLLFSACSTFSFFFLLSLFSLLGFCFLRFVHFFIKFDVFFGVSNLVPKLVQF